MKTLQCDICRKEVDNSLPERLYWTFREYDVCEDCKESIEDKLRPIIRTHQPYSQGWYENQFMGMVQRGVSNRRQIGRAHV